MEREVKVRLSVGLVSVVALHALLLAVVFSGLHHANSDTVTPWIDQLQIPSYQPPRPLGAPSMSTPPNYGTNHPALNELKQSSPASLDEAKGQSVTICPSCDVDAAQQWANKYGANLVTVRDLRRNTVQVYARLPEGRTWAATGTRTTRTFSGTKAHRAVIADMQLGLAATPQRPAPSIPVHDPHPPLPDATPSAPLTIPAPGPADPASPAAPASTAAPAAAAKSVQIALFVDQTPAGQQLLQWFNADRNLVDLRSKCEFQVYTPQNALYRARYAEVVPATQFPAILFLRADGGHIHAAGGAMLPSTPEQLYADLRASYRLSESVSNAPGLAQTGALRERGYNWDKAIAELDAGYVSAGECPPGTICPDDSEGRRPLLPRIFDNGPDKSAILWAGGSEIVMAILAIAAVILIGVILYKRL